MALPSSGNIDLNLIQDEFGAPRGTGLASFLRGGAWVPDTAINASVPTSLPIDMRDLLGASNETVSITNQSVSHTVFDPNNASVTYRLTNLGEVQRINASGTVVLETWLIEGAAGDYDVMVDVLSGTVPSGSAISTWLNLGTTRDWTLSRSTIGVESNQISVQLRPAGGGSTLDTATITMTATVN